MTSFDIHYSDEVASTQDLALAAAHAGQPAPQVWLAEVQTSGRGRRVGGGVRVWHAPVGSSVLMSLMLRPDLTVATSARLTLAVGVAVAETIAAVTGLDPKLKWPNDVEIDGAKVGGILVEGVVVGGALQAVAIGVGLNVNLDPALLPGSLDGCATSLSSAMGRTCDRMLLTTRLVPAIIAAAEALEAGDFTSILGRWRQRSSVAGRAVTVDGRRGTARDVAQSGALVVEFDGTLEHVSSGVVVFARPDAGEGG